MEDVLDGMDDLQHEEEMEELRASQRQQAEPEEPQNQVQSSSRVRQPLAERHLELEIDETILDPPINPGPIPEPIPANPVDRDSTSTRIGEPPGKEGMEADISVEVGNETEQADFEVHNENPERDQQPPGARPDQQPIQEDTEGEVGLEDQVDELVDEEEDEEPLLATQLPVDEPEHDLVRVGPISSKAGP
jgi:hypothetical protein